MLPVFQLLGTDYKKKFIASKFSNPKKSFDIFSKIDFIYDDAVASIRVGKGVKSEGELIISGTEGYIHGGRQITLKSAMKILPTTRDISIS